NLLIVPAQDARPLAGSRAPAGVRTAGADEPAAGGSRFLDERIVHTQLGAAGIAGVPLLFVAARVGDETVQVIGADLAAARRLHPSWRLAPGDHPSWIGARLARRFAIAPGRRVRITTVDRARGIDVVAGPTLEAG